jgi:hypothetical protein
MSPFACLSPVADFCGKIVWFSTRYLPFASLFDMWTSSLNAHEELQYEIVSESVQRLCSSDLIEHKYPICLIFWKTQVKTFLDIKLNVVLAASGEVLLSARWSQKRL